MPKFFKKPTFIIFIFIIIGLVIDGYLYFTRPQKPNYDFVIVKRGDISQEVNVTGKVKPASAVFLTFEKTGKITYLPKKVGDKVLGGEVLAQINNADILAQLAQTQAVQESADAQLRQYEAALEAQLAKLNELKRGARSEEIQIVQTKVDNAAKSLADAESNLKSVKDKAEIDLSNLYDDIKDILNDALLKTNDGLTKQIDEMFYNDFTVSPQLTFTITDFEIESNVRQKRIIANNNFTDLKKEIDNLPSDYSGLDSALIKTEERLISIRDFLNLLNEALNKSSGLS